MKCEYDGMELRKGERCPSCVLYNAAISAINVAADEIAKAYDRTARDAWMNDHGIYAWIGDVTVMVGSREQAAPFVALTSAARRVATFRRPPAAAKKRAAAQAGKAGGT